MMKALSLQEIKEMSHELKDIKKDIKMEKSFFSNKSDPYYAKLCGYWERAIKAENKLKDLKNE